MERRRYFHLIGVLGLGLGMTAALLVLLVGPPVARADPGTLYVAPDGDDLNDCSSIANRCRTVQRAMQVAQNGDEILVATGVYTTNGNAQVLHINRSVAIRGGYSSDFSTRDPEVYPTTLDAEGLGRVVYISNDITPTLEGLRLTNGFASTTGGGINSPSAHPIISGCWVYSNTANSFGGGVYLANGDGATLMGNRIYSNTANNGGGVYLYDSGATLTGNRIYSNTANNGGGGVYLSDSDGATLTGNRIYSNTASNGGGVCLSSSGGATLTGNLIYSNTADLYGGGVYLSTSGATLMGNRIYSNTASNRGGGAYLNNSDDATLMDNLIYSNTASDGGGVYLYDSGATLTGNRIYSNTADLYGGGVYLSNSDDATLTGNRIYTNTADYYGGGVYLVNSDGATLTGNRIYTNTADYYGGGVYLVNSDGATLTGNWIYRNTGDSQGGGVYLVNSDGATLTGNRIYSNTARWVGGGIKLFGGQDITLTNNLIVGNRVTNGWSAGLQLDGSSAHLLHTTLARNTGGVGRGIEVSDGSTLWMTNTILVGHTTALYVQDGCTATLQATLWGTGTWANTTDWAGMGTVLTGTLNWWDDPGFLNPASGDYRLTVGSAALDKGVDVGVDADFEGDPRPFCTAPDLGADEHPCCARLGTTLYTTPQAAVDASTAPNDVVQVTGLCLGVQQRGATSQTVYIPKTLTLRGGYSADFSTWDPQAHPTTLDAGNLGRVVYIYGGVAPTLEGLNLTRGQAAYGGGLYAFNAHPVISGCRIYGNAATKSGGGVTLWNGDGSTLRGDLVYSNTAAETGGGLYLYNSDATLTGNRVYRNTAGTGGGVGLNVSDATLVNNLIADNQASLQGSGLHVRTSSPSLLHTTLARNTGGAGQGVYIFSTSSATATVRMTDTILVGHAVGMETGQRGAAVLTATLWGSGTWANTTDTVGSNILTGTLNWWGDPAFVDPDAEDYHLGLGSAGFDRGVATPVSDDIDGDPRPVGPAPDLGMDEGLPSLALAKSGPAWANYAAPITYTLRLTNTGVVTAHAVLLTDTLPAGAAFVSASDGGTTSNGVVSWPTFSVPPGGGVVVRTFTVTATQSITNADYRATAQGMPGVAGTATVHTAVNQPPAADAGPPQSIPIPTATR